MKLKIMTWNISYAYGLGSDGVSSKETAGYVPHTLEQYENHLKQISDVISAEQPDIVLLQEVDFNSSRSHHVNQLEELSRTSGLIYREGLVSWDFPYVPYPGLSPKNHFGKVVSGGGILSRYPIIPVQDDLLPKPKENSRAYNLFYLARFIQTVQIQPSPEFKALTLANLHLEAFSKENRELHLIKLQNRLIDYSIDLAGGDFNGAIKLSETTVKTGWTDQVAKDPTFPSNQPTEFLDGFVIQKNRINFKTPRALNVGTASDHLPVVIEIDFNS